MKSFFNKLLSFFNTIEGKIAFYPALFAFGGLILAIISLSLEATGISKWLTSLHTAFEIDNGDTARTILSYLTAGLISIMVFSFSMVMVLLNQASSNYSPRVLPGLISNKSHQYVLGVYLGTIIYNIFITISIKSNEGNGNHLPSFSILITVLLTILCLCAFIYFIHSISQSIQVNNILHSEYRKAKERLKEIIDIQKQKPTQEFPDTQDWEVHKSNRTGYYQNLSLNNLLEICTEENILLHIVPIKGSFITENAPLFKTNRKVGKVVAKKIADNFNFADGEFVEDNYALGIKHITEIGIRAISPAVNDPSTTITTINFLTDLFALRLQKEELEIVLNKKNEPKLLLTSIPFDELLYQVMLPYRTYCKQDFSCIQKLFFMLHFLLKQKTSNPTYYEPIYKEIKNLYEDTKQSLLNSEDLKRLDQLYHAVNPS
ncbi:DUF2254 domain-containing protein [Mesonia sp. K7]|uniref:DUF2254 domain-containing protein n=1 Tax=Mesonia sp. K7 TaxID=2218606 RepID=UPI000DA9FDB5|nr:DUF2254 domain-containing protein [Mesonia sp. K7]PZD76933.1 DUF2254 domain-containing protein [Mesonia sp. K7]